MGNFVFLPGRPTGGGPVIHLGTVHSGQPLERGVGPVIDIRCVASCRLNMINNQMNQMAQRAAANAAEAQARANQLIEAQQRLNEELDRSKQELARQVSYQPGLKVFYVC